MTSNARSSNRRSSRRVMLLAPVPGTSRIHELWAGTKLLVVLGFSVLLWFFPGWVTIVLGWALVLTAARIAHIPRGALPSWPRRLWILFALGFTFASLSGGSPVISVGGVEIGLGGASHYVRAVALAVCLFGLAAMLSWTTNVAEVVPALTTLARPLKLLRLPIEEWAVTVALGLRAFPMLIEEFQVLYAAHRLRTRQLQPDGRAGRRQQARDVIDLIAAAVAMTLRRADEMGNAITARGGTGQLSAAPARPGLADWVTLGVAAAAGGLAVAAETLLHH
ncbi:energy-coupling factor transporter transmembrane protein EcfT [Mycobacterium vicinigordonae]|uniref:Energy-coupling factor transporter transmembrane protein EcfT n=1 Tax=Mycobacterium vicinigordonae TaxID=1719132 RepID=A0A7D6I7P6_9MYCO|nr:energy-coupling factor transporter transmembrane protein EcfT [Mycobacterium vicinigordonae]QLL07796.1 energy-coupling factor transporter transmembrane protein EcfT [Mycobacterium vicinigordonae]